MEELFLECFPKADSISDALNSHDCLEYDENILDIKPATGEAWAVFEGTSVERDVNGIVINGRIVQFSNTDETGNEAGDVQITLSWNGQNGAYIVESITNYSPAS